MMDEEILEIVDKLLDRNENDADLMKIRWWKMVIVRSESWLWTSIWAVDETIVDLKKIQW